MYNLQQCFKVPAQRFFPLINNLHSGHYWLKANNDRSPLDTLGNLPGALIQGPLTYRSRDKRLINLVLIRPHINFFVSYKVPR
jgi:hypothetical protein